jgi:TPP-dependent pyruvate/acetoin dehydrogenase alpha subunit
LIASGRLTEAQDLQLWETARQQITQAVDKAEKTPALDPRTMFDDVFAKASSLLQEERQDLEQFLPPEVKS